MALAKAGTLSQDVVVRSIANSKSRSWLSVLPSGLGWRI